MKEPSALWLLRHGQSEGNAIRDAAQGSDLEVLDPAQAACWASYLHGTAGDRLTARIGPVGFLARELLDEIPPAMAELSR